MRYGEGFWVVRGGVRLPTRVYPASRGFDYNDGTGDGGELLLEDFSVDYTPGGSDVTIRITIAGSPNPELHKTSFDWDWASIPGRLARFLTCDKADYRIRAASLLHDALFCVLLPDYDLSFANRLLYEIMEVYNRELMPVTGNWLERRKCEAINMTRSVEDKALRLKVYAGVKLGSRFCWGKKTPDEVAMYRKLITVERIPL